MKINHDTAIINAILTNHLLICKILKGGNICKKKQYCG